MPEPTMRLLRHRVVVALLLTATSSVLAQPLPLPQVEATSTTPLQREALAIFQLQAQQLCRTLYLRLDAASNCLQRILDAALPLDLAPTGAVPREDVPLLKPRSGTVAPDGRE
jgi:hypothetical protein